MVKVRCNYKLSYEEEIEYMIKKQTQGREVPILGEGFETKAGLGGDTPSSPVINSMNFRVPLSEKPSGIPVAG
jgi:hypothetical protein